MFRVFSGPLGFVRNLQVTDPTTSTLNVRWEPAEGNVREYIVIWIPAAGGDQDVVRLNHFCLCCCDIMSFLWLFINSDELVMNNMILWNISLV